MVVDDDDDDGKTTGTRVQQPKPIRSETIVGRCKDPIDRKLFLGGSDLDIDHLTLSNNLLVDDELLVLFYCLQQREFTVQGDAAVCSSSNTSIRVVPSSSHPQSDAATGHQQQEERFLFVC